MSRFCGYLWAQDECITIALLPRIRLALGSDIGLGFQWLTGWFHVWLWNGKKFWRGTMIDLTPHIWLFIRPHYGAYLHLWWLTWRSSVLLYRSKYSQAS